MAKRKNTFLVKRSNIAGKVPAEGDLLLGEMALNTADVILYASGTTAGSILPIGWDRVSITGDTVTGDYIINGDLTVTGNTNINGPISATSIDIDYIDFNTEFTGGTIEGRLHWDIDNGGLTMGMEGGQVSQQIGQELYYYIKNQSGATIENGRVVKASGTLGASGHILGEYMIADGSVPPKFALGIATEDILNGTDGFVTEFGLVRGIDATGAPYGETWNDGDILYVSSTIAGGLTKVEPESPNLHIEMAIVIHSDINGSIFVRPHRYPYINDLQNVGYSAGTESEFDILQWDITTSAFTITSTPQLISVSATTISATTYYGDGSNLTGLTLEQDYLLDIYQSGTTAIPSTTYVDIVWDSDVIVGNHYSYVGGEITINEAGWYEVSYSVSIDVSTGGRKTSKVILLLDSGGGFVEIPRTAAFGYNRTITNGEDTMTKTIKQLFSSGDKIKVQARVEAGGGSLVTVADSSNITMTKLSN